MTAFEPIEAGRGDAACALRLMVVSDSPPERNGVGSYYADLVHQLHGRVERSVMVCPTGRRSPWNRYLLPPLPGDSTQKVWLPNPVQLWRTLLEVRPHVVVLPTPGPYGLFGLLAARWLGIPVIAGFHTHYEALAGIYWATPFGSVSRWYLSLCNRVLFRRSALVLANSPDMLRQAKQFGAGRVELMGTSVSREFIERPTRPPGDRLQRILFVGRLAEEKNLPAVVEAARALPHLQFTVAGDGPLRGWIQAAARQLPNLTYVGWQSREALVDIIDAHDLLLLPSRVESFGTVALEAMARGRLVLVSRACGITEWPELARGLFVIGEDESTAQALERIAAMPGEQRAGRAQTARLAALRLHDWNLGAWTTWLRESSAGHAR